MRTAETEFDSAGIEGMIDVLCNCLVIFMLLAALVRIDASKVSETSLSDMDLSSVSGLPAGGGAAASVTLSMKQTAEGLQILLDDETLPFEALEDRLKSFRGLVRIALRRDPKLPIGLEDEVIAACRRAGVEKVTLIVKAAGASNG